MYVIPANAAIPPSAIPGIAHRTLARYGDGLESMSVWKQTMAPGGRTPPHRHDCDETVVVLAGSGVLLIDGRALPFAAGDTLVLPAGRVHQIVNDGTEPVVTVAAFASSPVVTALPDGQTIELPWAS